MTKSDDILDDQALGSFVDGLLDAAHSEKIIRAMEDDPEIRERVYQLRRAKDLMKLGFGNASTPSGNTAKARFRNWKLFQSLAVCKPAAESTSRSRRLPGSNQNISRITLESCCCTASSEWLASIMR